MTNADASVSVSSAPIRRDSIPGQIVLVQQGGGALGAYQLGVYQALHESGVEPDWIIGTSIGAINGAIMAGNPFEQRWARLRQFWDRMAILGVRDPSPARFWEGLTNLRTLALGIPGFFEPNPSAGWGPMAPVGVEHASYYVTRGLRETLDQLVDFDYLAQTRPRLTIGAVNARTGTSPAGAQSDGSGARGF